MFDKRAIDLIKQQVLKEVYSSYLYVEFANYFKDKGLDGFYNWYDIQAKEELDHAKLFIKYLKKIGVDLEYDIPEIDKPSVLIINDLDALIKGLEHEQYVTSLIKAIYNAAYNADDKVTMNLLKWFLNEQEEEEKNATELIEKYKSCIDSRDLAKLNEELGEREYKAPSLVI